MNQYKLKQEKENSSNKNKNITVKLMIFLKKINYFCDLKKRKKKIIKICQQQTLVKSYRLSDR